MSPLYLHNGKLLLVGGALATSENCCCGGNGMCISPNSVNLQNLVNRPTCDGGVIWLSYASKLCYTCTPIDSTGCPSCTVQIPSPITSFPDVTIIYDCNNAVCDLSADWGIDYNLKELTSEQKTNGTIANTSAPDVVYSIDANFIDTNYPQEDGWKIFYTEESVLREEREYNCDYSSNSLICRGWNTTIRVFAIKDCSYAGGGSLEEITDDTITGSTSSTTGAIQISNNNWAWLPFSETEDCTYPPLFNIASLLSVECFDTNFNCATGEPY